MPRATWTQIRIKFEARYEAQCRERAEIPEVREALSAIRLEVWRRWKNGEPIEASAPTESVSRLPKLFWHEISVCRSHGLFVSVEDRGTEVPLVRVGLGRKSEQEGQAARIKYPQNLLGSEEYDLWEISREAPLSRILEDVEYQWRALYQERQQIAKAEFPGESALSTPLPKRTESTDRTFRAIEAYRRRISGQLWREVVKAVGRSERALRRAVGDLCKRTELPWPEKGTVLPGAPDANCDACAKRRSPSTPCPECPWIRFADSYLGAGEGAGLESPRDGH